MTRTQLFAMLERMLPRSEYVGGGAFDISGGSLLNAPRAHAHDAAWTWLPWWVCTVDARTGTVRVHFLAPVARHLLHRVREALAYEVSACLNLEVTCWRGCSRHEDCRDGPDEMALACSQARGVRPPLVLTYIPPKFGTVLK